MNFIKLFITEYTFPIASTVITGIITYIGIHIKNKITQYTTNKIEVSTAEKVYHAIEELYPTMPYQEKINKIEHSLLKILEIKKIKVTKLELQMLIYSTIHKEKR